MTVAKFAMVMAFAIAVSPAHATSPAVEEAVKALAEIETDKSKLDPYCALIMQFSAAGQDQPKIDALAEQFDDLVRSFGPKFQAALDLHNELDDESADGKAMNTAFERIDVLCPP